jgi:hypothetical protein
MSVSIISIGTNTKQIVIRDEVDSAATIAAFNTQMTTLGWTLYDTIAETEFCPVVTKVYRVINKDAVTYKYFIVVFDTIRWEIRTHSCEDWNTTTHAPVNRTWDNVGCFPQYYDLVASEIVVNATNQHAVLWTFYENKADMWSGVFEFNRLDSATTTPCFAWTNSELLGQDNYHDAEFIFPRTVLGGVGAATGNVYQPLISRGARPQGLGSCMISSYLWQPLKTPVSSISADGITSFMPFGEMLGCGVTANLGEALDTTRVNADTVLNTPLETGTPLDYFMLPLNGGSVISQSSSHATTITNSATNIATAAHIVVGQKVFIANSAGVQRPSGAGLSEPLVTLYADTGGIYDMVFDGKNTIYAPTTTGVIAINVTTNAITSLTLTDGGKYIAIDNKRIYVTSRTASLTPKIHVIDRATFTLTATNTSTATPATTTYGRPEVDYKGFCYCAVKHPAVAYNAAYKMIKVDYLGATTTSAGVYSINTSTTANVRPLNWYYDYGSDTLYALSSYSSNSYISKMNSDTLVIVGTYTSLSSASNSGIDTYGLTTSTTQALCITAFKGFAYVWCDYFSISGYPTGYAISLQSVPSGTISTSGAITSNLKLLNKSSIKGSVVYTMGNPAGNPRTSKISNIHPVTMNRLAATSGRLLVKA